MVTLALLITNGCAKDGEHEIVVAKKTGLFEKTEKTEMVMTACDDTTAFKSTVDLESLAILQGCYSCASIKTVPGLGEIPWYGNCEVYIVYDTLLEFRFMTYELYFEEYLKREELSFSYVPLQKGLYAVFDNEQWQQNMGLSFGSYGRSLDDGDVADGFWGVDTTCSNFIEITRLDLGDKEIEGKFEIHLKMKSQGTHGILYSERINFGNGKFKARIFNY